MSFNPRKPITASNCPTRAALERKPGDKDFLVESIHARHTQAKASRRGANLQARGDASKRLSRGGTSKKAASK